jgi:tight adherence protein B
MDITLILLIALSVAALGWTAFLFIPGMTPAGKKKLSARLSNEARIDGPSLTHRPILLASQRTGLPKFMDKWTTVVEWQRWLNHGYPEATLAKFLLITSILTVTLSAAATVMVHNTIVITVCAGTGLIVPIWWVYSKRAKRRNQFNTQLPEALDFLSRVLRSGQSMSTGLQMMSEELPQPLAGEFRRCYDQHSLGQSLEDGLRDMVSRVNSTDFSFFVTAVIIQRQSGGDLGEVLGNISGLIRKRLRLAQGVKAKTAEGRLTGYIMVCFPFLMFLILNFINPDYTHTLLNTELGHKFLATAFCLQMGGLWMINKITSVKV